MKKIHEYEVEVWCGGMQYPTIGTLTIEAENKKEAIQWVVKHIGYSAKKIS